MKQYCRYCSHCVYGDAVYCEVLNNTMSEKKAKRVNKCKHFELNEIDVFNINKTYKPKQTKKKEAEQTKLF